VVVCFGVLILNLYRLQVEQHDFIRPDQTRTTLKCCPSRRAGADFRSQRHPAGTEYYPLPPAGDPEQNPDMTALLQRRRSSI
jgi:penicillin-binding protein 2